MQATNGVILPGDIGGPMSIGNGYRWNVPVVTYGFDQSFLDFFGSNGVAAVENTISILNALPPASGIVLTNYPLYSQRVNYTAQAQSLLDLQSETLSLLLEQMGLAKPSRYTYVLRQWNPVFATDPAEWEWPDGIIPTYVAQLNFDPLTFTASSSVDGVLYDAEIIIQRSNQYYAEPFIVDPDDFPDPAVADFGLFQGGYYTALTRDDVGGLACLLSPTNVNYETLLPGIVGVGTNTNWYVNGAWRPGVDRITFVPHPVDTQSGQFLSTNSYYTDTYLSNGLWQQQQLMRPISKPDFLFSAGDVGGAYSGLPFFTRTGTTNWINNAVANGDTNGAGPGVIQPQVNIVFNKLGPTFEGFSDQQPDVFSEFYGSYEWYNQCANTVSHVIGHD